MEENVFRRPAVAGLLQEKFVEARLHTDYEVNMELQQAMTQSSTQPIYLVIDPATGEPLTRRDGATLSSDDPFIEFLESGWSKERGKQASRDR